MLLQAHEDAREDATGGVLPSTSLLGSFCKAYGILQEPDLGGRSAGRATPRLSAKSLWLTQEAARVAYQSNTPLTWLELSKLNHLSQTKKHHVSNLAPDTLSLATSAAPSRHLRSAAFADRRTASCTRGSSQPMCRKVERPEVSQRDSCLAWAVPQGETPLHYACKSAPEGLKPKADVPRSEALVDAQVRACQDSTDAVVVPCSEATMQGIHSMW